ncbi:hypothetical protein V9K67_04235 [Paraflavisolibacter sp. H34]
MMLQFGCALAAESYHLPAKPGLAGQKKKPGTFAPGLPHKKDGKKVSFTV